MALSPGTRIGSYDITAKIGEGGMGEVYRATDTKLKRPVALKVLPESVANDRERLARFQREAEVLASLNHTNIAGIYGVEESGGVKALVMEFVQGPTLADRIAQGAVPVDDALPIARQIAEALEAAHEQGIIHRDLKPANIKVRPDGTVKVLDFGLAKAMEPSSVGRGFSPAGGVAASQAPTITSPAMMTGVGMILGTAAYMSPEQARGKPVDRRADIWAFGCVLYEMLTGKRAFDGEDVTETLASVVKSEPAWQLPPLPPLVRLFLRQALDKDPRRRLGDIREMRLALEGALTLDALAQTSPPMAIPLWRRPWATAIAGALIAALVGGAFAARRGTETTAQPVVRFDILPPEGGLFPGANNTPRMEVSPDGQYLAITAVANAESPHQLWIRRIDNTDATAITTFTELAGEPVQQPFWSPDSRALGFFIAGTLRRINPDGSGMRTITNVPGNNFGGAWNSDGTIVYGTSQSEGLMRVSSSGGTPNQLTTLDKARGEIAHYWPQFMPDGLHFLYLAVTDGAGDSIWAGSLDSSERTLVTESAAMGRFVTQGYLLFLQGESLLAQRMDPDTFTLQGEPIVIVDQVQLSANRRAAFSVSNTGVLVFRRGTNALGADSQLAWVDRNGRELTSVGQPANIRGLDLSADGRRAAIHRENGEGAGDIWWLDLERGTSSRVTFQPERHNLAPVLSPDGARVVFGRVRAGALASENWALFERAAAGVGEERRLFQVDVGAVIPWDVSPDGATLLFSNSSDRERDADLWVMPMTGGGSPSPFVQAVGRQNYAQFSPDGRWVAYASDETGRSEVYVQSYPAGDVKYQVSVAGGNQPRWRGDGRELFYRTLQAGTGLGSPLAGVEVTYAGKDLRFGSPKQLAETDPNGAHVAQTFNYAPAPDGQRFLMIRRSGISGQAAARIPVTVVVNWQDELKRPAN